MDYQTGGAGDEATTLEYHGRTIYLENMRLQCNAVVADGIQDPLQTSNGHRHDLLAVVS